MSSRRAVRVSRTCAANRSPPSRRWYSRIPSRPNAHVRGEVVSRIAGSARSKCAAAHAGRSDRRDRPTHVPSAQRARPVGVLGTGFFEPAAVEAQEVTEPSVFGVEGRLKERRVPGREPVQLLPLVTLFLQQHRQKQRAGVVVGVQYPSAKFGMVCVACWSIPVESVSRCT